MQWLGADSLLIVTRRYQTADDRRTIENAYDITGVRQRRRLVLNCGDGWNCVKTAAETSGRDNGTSG